MAQQVTYRSAAREARKRLNAKHAELDSWRKVGLALGGLNKGLVSAVARGKRAPTPQLLEALGLPVIRKALAPVCPKCGVVHTTKRCTAGRTAKRKRTNWKGIALMCMAAWAAEAREK